VTSQSGSATTELNGFILLRGGATYSLLHVFAFRTPIRLGLTLKSTPHLIVVEDDHDLRRDLVDFLKLRGFTAFACSNADEFAALERRACDLVLLDIGLPGKGGIEILKELRSVPDAPKVVILSAYGSDHDRVQGLNLGADAYVVKGASLEVIEATCRAILRQNAAAELWSVDSSASTLRAPNGRIVLLTHQEFTFLRAVLDAPGKVVPREDLLRALEKGDTLSNQRNLDNVIARLRRKVLQTVGLDLPVRSAYGSGYVYG
jgi:two-component system, OmpR family, response regulator